MNDHTSIKRGYFIVLEGIEGMGKSTALNFLHEQLNKHHIPHVVTREPGGTLIADAIRQLLLTSYNELMNSDTELLLMFASRAQNISQVIKPALERGQWVLCDRFTDASYAYQGGGRQIPTERISILEKWVHDDLHPDCVLVLDAPVDVGLMRIQERKTKDRIEREQHQFFERVRTVYLERAKKNLKRYKIIDASGDIETVKKQLTTVINHLIEAWL